MYIKVNFDMFLDAFRALGREDSYSYDGMKAIFNYIEDETGLMGDELELDVVAICGEFEEFEDIERAHRHYMPDTIEAPDRKSKTAQLRDIGCDILHYSDGIIVRN